MARRSAPTPPPIEAREFRSGDEIDVAIRRLDRRLKEFERLDVRAAYQTDDGSDDVAISNLRSTVLEVFGQNSHEYDEHKHISLWAGPMFVNMPDHEVMAGRERGRIQTIGIIKGLIDRLKEKKEDLEGGAAPSPTSYFDKLNLHPRIGDVARERFLDGYHWDAVFAGSKALVNYVREKSGSDLDGAKLMTTAFSKNKPMLAFNDLADQTDLDEQEGMMHLFLGAVLAIRNPGGHSFPEGSEQRAIEYISLLSMLAYRVQEAKRVRQS